MTEKTYFIRWRGKMEGPFSLDDLKRRVSAGRLSRLHDISADQSSWQQAKDWPEIFPPVAEAPAQGKAQEAEAGEPQHALAPVEEGAEGVPTLEEAVTWYCEKQGQVEGPYATEDILAMIEEGELGPDSRVCSSKNPDRWDFVGGVPELASALSPQALGTPPSHLADSFKDEAPGLGGWVGGAALVVVGAGLGLAAFAAVSRGGGEPWSWAAGAALGVLGLVAVGAGGAWLWTRARRANEPEPHGSKA